jgi:hypothetical protein
MIFLNAASVLIDAIIMTMMFIIVASIWLAASIVVLVCLPWKFASLSWKAERSTNYAPSDDGSGSLNGRR